MHMDRRDITDDILDRAFDVTGRALEKVTISPPDPSHMHDSATDMLDMAKRYISDAGHFREKGDRVNAFGALYYAHAWLDAGARLGLFDVGKDYELFTLLR